MATINIQRPTPRNIDYGTVLGAGVLKKAWRKTKKVATRLPSTVARQSVNVVKDIGKGAQRSASIVKSVATGDFSKAGRQSGRMAKAMTVNLASNIVKSGTHNVLQTARTIRDSYQAVGYLAAGGAQFVSRVLRRAFRLIIRKSRGTFSGFGSDIPTGETSPAMEQKIDAVSGQVAQAVANSPEGNARGIIKAICVASAPAIVIAFGPEAVPFAPLAAALASPAFDLAWKDEMGASEARQQSAIQPNSQGNTSVPGYNAPDSTVPSSFPESLAPGASSVQQEEPKSNTGLIIGAGAVIAALTLI